MPGLKLPKVTYQPFTGNAPGAYDPGADILREGTPVSVAETESGGAAGSPAGPADVAASLRGRRWLVVLIGIAAVVLAVLAILLGQAAVYQPIAWGNMQAPFPGLPPGVGVKVVNNFGLLGGDYYVPPQRGVFSFGATIVNNGSWAVTIEGVTLFDSPDSAAYPVQLAGPVRYSADMGQVSTPRTYILHNLTLRPGQLIFIGIPMRTWPCGQTGGWTSIGSFYVQERYLFFNHAVALPWTSTGGSLIMRLPGGKPGDANTICAPQ